MFVRILICYLLGGVGMYKNLQDWLEHLEQLQPDRIELGLDRIKQVAVNLKVDQPGFRIITVAGTNGKGSTVAYINSMLAELGYTTGVYTSPHFIHFNERIVVNGKRADESVLCRAFTAIESARGDVPLTYFEFTTLAAIWCFKDAGIDVVILEVGLGGRLDATNAWDSEVACISSIGIDHIDWLGDDRESIGAEKAGVARYRCPLVCGDTDPPASIERVASETGARLLQRGRDFTVERQTDGSWQYRDAMSDLQLPAPSIIGQWACDNAAVSICAVSQFLASPPPLNVVEKALQNVVIPGRMQMLQAANTWVILDVAHNQAAAEKLEQYLQAEPVSGDTRAVFGCMHDKDAGGIISSLAASVDKWFVAEIDYPRAMAGSEISDELRLHGVVNSQIFASVIHAVNAAVAQSGPEDRVVVLGSFHVIGPALELLDEQPLELPGGRFE